MSDLEGFGFVMPHWLYWGWLAVVPLLLMWLTRGAPTSRQPDEASAVESVAEEDPVRSDPGNRLTRVLDRFSNLSGVFVAFWTINAVLAYVYEVFMRYVFNMPTIWVHEASYLLFGMQYLLAGAFALLHGDHVRVDILYVKLPERGRVGIDIFTSVFFFIFVLALTGTAWTFFADAFAMQERSMETWAVQHWPVKAMMLTGAILIGLAGLSKLIKDIRLYRRLGAAL